MLGGFFSLLPDIPAVWNYLLHGNLEHTMAGPIPTHSLVFCSLAFFSTALLGQLLYRHRGKAVALGGFTGAASLSHLLLDDVAGGGIHYFYPFYGGSVNLFSHMNIDLSEVNFMYYNLAGMVTVMIISSILLMTIWSLNYLGFGYKYQPLVTRTSEREKTPGKTVMPYGHSLK
jgi:inner membrane protein